MSIQPNYAFLENHPLFAVLTPEERLYFIQNSAHATFTKHAVIYKPEHAADKVYFLMEGTVKVAVHAEKKDIIKYVVRPTAIFGECPLTGEKMRRDFAYAMDDLVHLVEFNAQAWIKVMQQNFAFAQSVLYFLGERLRYTENQLENVVLKDSKSRILDFLKQMGVEQGRKVGYETLVKHNMTHQDIADLTGTSRQMVTAVLNQLKRSNVLYFNRKKLLFRDLSRFEYSVI